MLKKRIKNKLKNIYDGIITINSEAEKKEKEIKGNRLLLYDFLVVDRQEVIKEMMCNTS
jgi:hypothetical protein